MNNPSFLNKKSMFEILPRDKKTIVFLGDSITDNCNWSELLQDSKALNRGIGGDKTYGIINRIDEIISLKPDKIFIMIGVNDIGEGRNIDEIIHDYEVILMKINKETPETKVFVQSILPTNKDILGGRDIYNPKIVEINQKLKILADKYEATYIDLYALMVTSEGQLNPELTIDGLHITGLGYKLWKTAIEVYLRDP